MPLSMAVDPFGSDAVRDDLAKRVRRVCEIAGQHADAVDKMARHPREALAASKAEGLLGAMVPAEWGGEGARLSEIAEACYQLGRACSSTAMIFAMHQSALACVLRHGIGAAWHEDFLRRVASEQLLVASSTTEGRNGGDVRKSEAPLEWLSGRVSLRREATVISYGAEADAIATTARRAPESSPSDQVLCVFLRGQYELNQIVEWDVLGMRGTRSAGFALSASGDAAQILPSPYEVIHTETMTPVSHLLWSSVWAGIAAGAVERARRSLRKASLGGSEPATMHHFSKAQAALRALRALIATHLDGWEAVGDDRATLSTVTFHSAISLLKVDASELAVSAAMSALRACGLPGYRNDTEFSVARPLRDLLSAPLMISNDRILSNIGRASLLSDVAPSIKA